MRPIVQAALRSLQGLAYARAADQCRRVEWLSHRPARLDARPSSLVAWEECTAALRRAMTPDELAELRIRRAVYLRMLLDSAPARLQAWADEHSLADMPASHLLEWVSYDLERLELAEIEATLTPSEEERYVREALGFRGFE